MIKMILSDVDDDRDRAIEILQGDNYKYILQDLDNYLRNCAKSDIDISAVDIRDKIQDFCEGSGVTLWD